MYFFCLLSLHPNSCRSYANHQYLDDVWVMECAHVSHLLLEYVALDPVRVQCFHCHLFSSPHGLIVIQDPNHLAHVPHATNLQSVFDLELLKWDVPRVNRSRLGARLDFLGRIWFLWWDWFFL